MHMKWNTGLSTDLFWSLVKENGITHPIQKNHDAPTLASHYRIDI